MIYIFGDIHGALEVYKVTNYMNNVKYSSDDVIILLGDVGVTWDDSTHDQEVINKLQSIDCLKLFIDGNHENFDLLHSYPEYKWHGGYVTEICEDILHLQRGYVFDIKGLNFFAFGGAHSIDKDSRIEGINWWEDELPIDEEYARGLQALRKHNYQVDYIITHCAPYEVHCYMDKELCDEEEEFLHYLQNIADNVEFTKWYFGHYHEDCEIEDIYECVYDEVKVINE